MTKYLLPVFPLEESSSSAPHLLVLSETLKRIRRTHGTAQQGKTALITADLVQLVVHLPTNLLGTRDRALALVGYAGGLRRAELAELEELEPRASPRRWSGGLHSPVPHRDDPYFEKCP